MSIQIRFKAGVDEVRGGPITRETVTATRPDPLAVAGFLPGRFLG